MDHFNMPNTSPAMNTPDYWIAKIPDPDQLLMNGSQIKSFNINTLNRLSCLMDISSFPEDISDLELKKIIKTDIFNSNSLYQEGRILTSREKGQIQAQLNLSSILKTNPVRYGLTTCRSNLRTFPENHGIFREPDDIEFDLFQETAINPCEPLLILHQSLNRQWYFVQVAFYRGWLPADNVAFFSNRQDWLAYLITPERITVTDNSLTLVSPHGEKWLFEMGSQIPVVQYVAINNQFNQVKLPIRQDNGEVQFIILQITKENWPKRGYLPFTRRHLIQQAFKMFGMKYSWGGREQTVDCSAFTRNIFRTFGLDFPRNACEQEQIPGKLVKLSSLEPREKKVILDSLQPGALLFLKGHVLLYLGKDECRYYVIHALSALGMKTFKKVKKMEVMRVVVSDLSLLRPNGQSFLQELTSALIIE